MLEVANWIQKYFNQSPDAIFLFKDDELLVSNQPAQQLIANLKLNVNYLLQMGKNAWVEQGNDNCSDCLIKNQLRNATVPVTFEQEAAHPLRFSLIYRPLDIKQNIIALTIENREQQQRISQVEQQRILNRYVNEAHEKERQRISQDLHDSIAQGIYSAIIGVQRLTNQENNNPEQIQTISTAVERQLRTTLKEIKNMALNIRPSILDNFGLVPAIKGLAKRVEASTGITINIIALTTAKNLPVNIQNVLYRISQEAINNAVKHAKPTEINVIITNHDNYIKMEVLDNGVGFDRHQQTGFNSHSLGLMNMNERVKAYNGAFDIKSKLNKGTTVTVSFPYNDLSKNKDMVN